MRENQEFQSFSVSEMALKLRKLEEIIEFGERTKGELRERLMKSEESNKELVSFMKGLQSQNDKEMSTLRQIIQQKITEDSASSNKSNEKN
jgi:hypothetical protein